jgi:hypothetical protein
MTNDCALNAAPSTPRGTSMTNTIKRGTTPFRAFRLLRSLLPGALLLSCAAGCDSDAPVDKRFAAQTYDEYTEPLTNAIIGSPSGVTVISPAGVTSDVAEGALTAAAPAATKDGGVIISGAGGSPSGGFGDGGVTPPDHSGQALWLFNDCDPTSNFLTDSTGGGANAQHALKSSCVPGIEGLGVNFRSAKDVVQVPDEPEFTVSTRVGVAAWVHPATVTGDQPIVLKRLNNQTSFSLGIHNGNIEMSVVLSTGKTVISRAPIAPGVWTHVGGTFDGTFVFLFINGQQFGQVFGAGTIRNVFAPLRIGATTQSQFFNGVIDNVFVSTLPDARDQIIAQSCIVRPSTMVVNLAASGPVPFGTTVHYDVAVTNNNVGVCSGSNSYDMFFQFLDPGISINFTTSSFQNATSGQTVTFGVDVSSTEDADVGVHQLPFVVENFGSTFEFLTGNLVYEVTQPDCFVSTRKELMITNTSVVDDPVRTSAQAVPGPGSNATPGVWTFGHLMRELAPTPEQAPAMTLALFQHWLTDQTVNGFTVAARPLMQQSLLDIWPKTPTGDLDLDQAPLQLLAIVNRIDTRDLASGSAGEGRFVFGVQVQPRFAFPPEFTLILEYHLVAQTQDDVMTWANLWHGLSSHPFPSEEYNAALEDITKRFSNRNAQPSGVNGSALDELRTNEIELSPFGQWELRGFALSPSTGFFDEVTVKETPDLSFNFTPTLANLINANAVAIKAVVPGANGHTMPEQVNGVSFLGGSVINSGFFAWSAPGVVDPDARFHMSLNTCNGCHGQETNTRFLMVSPRFTGQEAQLSPFLTGTTVFDQFSGQVRTLNDLGRRRTDLTGLVCPGSGTPPPPTDAGAPPAIDAGRPVIDAGRPPVDASPRPPTPDAGTFG